MTYLHRANRIFVVRQLRVYSFKFIIKKSDVPDDAKTVSKNGKLIGITEVTINVLLFCMRAGRGL